MRFPARLTCLAFTSIALAPAWAGPASVESNIDRAIEQANAMVKLGVSQPEIERWLLQQVQGDSDPGQDSPATVTVQTAPPTWDVYATAAWVEQKTAMTGGAESQGENVYIRTRLDTSQADEGLIYGQAEKADVDQRGTEAADPLHAPNSAQRTDDVRVGAGGPTRQ